MSASSRGLERVYDRAYGEPEVFPFGDLNGGYTVDSADEAIFRGMLSAPEPHHYCLLADVNLDDEVDNTDGSILLASYLGRTGGADVLSTAEVANDIGYAGYLWNAERGQWHVRHRELATKLGRWLQRDPAGYIDGMSLYEYVGSGAVSFVDPDGLRRRARGPRKRVHPDCREEYLDLREGCLAMPNGSVEQDNCLRDAENFLGKCNA